MTYDECRKVLTETMARPDTGSKQEASEAMAFLLVDMAQSLSNIADALYSIDQSYGASS